MPNPFEREFSKDPSLKRMVDDASRRKADQTRAAELEKQQENCAQRIREELDKCDEMVTGVLEDLGEIMYPGWKVVGCASRRGYSSYYGRSVSVSFFTEPTQAAYWQIGDIKNVESYGRSGENQLTLIPTITVGIEASDSGELTAFICNLKKSGSTLRTRKCVPTKEALIRALVELHQPDPVLREISERSNEVLTVLEKYIESPVLEELVDDQYYDKLVCDYTYERSRGKILSVASESFLSRHSDLRRDPESKRYDNLQSHKWTISHITSNFYQHEPDLNFDRDAAQVLIEVRIVFDDTRAASHYKCLSRYSFAGGKVVKSEKERTAALDADSLANAIEQLIAEIEAEQQQFLQKKSQRLKRRLGLS